MAHPKLSNAAHRAMLAATTAALVAGPLAAAGAAQSLDPVTDAVEMTCEEARKTDDTALIDEFCSEEELEKATSPLSKSVDTVTDTANKTVEEGREKVAPKSDDDGGGEEKPSDGDGDGGGGGGG